MAYNGWLSFGGTEIINNARVAAYAKNMGLPPIRCECAGLQAALNHADYTTPQEDGAPWYDPAVPESAGVAGFLGLEFVGFMKSTANRTKVSLINDGAVTGRLTMQEREILIRGAVLVCDDCSLSYAISWLAGVLRGAICGTSCLGDELCVLSCCPTCQTGQTQCGSGFLRRLFNVTLIDGVEITSVKPVSGGCCGSTGKRQAYLAKFEFTLLAGWPWLYREPTLIAANVVTLGSHTKAAGSGTANCGLPASCLTDPLCPPGQSPPAPPFVPDECACRPVDQTGTIVCIPKGRVPEAFQKVPILNVYAGSSDMRCVTIRWYNNPTGTDCLPGHGTSCVDLVKDPCAACVEINIPYLPAYSTFVLDGRVKEATVDCAGPGGIASNVSTLTGVGGRPFVWPVFDCAAAMCVEFLAGKNNHPADAKLWVWMVAREDAG